MPRRLERHPVWAVRCRFHEGKHMPEQVPFGAVEFAENPEPRCPCVLLLDTSGSMSGSPIAALTSGVALYKQDLASDSLAAKRVEVAIVAFGGSVRTLSEFTSAEAFAPPALSASGETPMGEAILRGIEMVRQRKDTYRSNGIQFYRPWVFLITDGVPTDSWHEAAAAIRKGEKEKAFTFWAVGTESANFDTLKEISSPERPPLKLDGMKFGELFRWLSNSQQSVSRSQPGASSGVKVEDPTHGPSGWASVPV